MPNQLQSNKHNSRLILASGSARRRDLLTQIGIEPHKVVVPDIDETPIAGELPRVLAQRLASAKLRAGAEMAAHRDGCYVLSADTVVALGRRVLDKAADKAAARAHLRSLSGRRHTVYGGIAILPPSGRQVTRVVVTKVRFAKLQEADIEQYLATDEWRGKAGAYAIQGTAASFVPWINGSYSNIVGLALCEVWHMLASQGFVK